MYKQFAAWPALVHRPQAASPSARTFWPAGYDALTWHTAVALQLPRPTSVARKDFAPALAFRRASCVFRGRSPLWLPEGLKERIFRHRAIIFLSS